MEGVVVRHGQRGLQRGRQPGGFLGVHDHLREVHRPDAQAVGRQDGQVEGPNRSGMVSSSGTRSESPPKKTVRPPAWMTKVTSWTPCLPGVGGHGEVADRGGFPGFDDADVAETLVPRDGRDRAGADQRGVEVEAAGDEGVEVAVVVVLVR